MSWHTLLAAAVGKGTKASVARDLGVSRTAVSLLLAGKYPGDTAKMAKRVRDAYERLDCPHLDRPVTQTECAQNSGKIPTSNPAALQLWRACQKCGHNPKKTEQAHAV